MAVCCMVFHFTDAPRSSAMTRQLDLRQKCISIFCLVFGGKLTKSIQRCSQLLSCLQPNTVGRTNSFYKNVHTSNQTRTLPSGMLHSIATKQERVHGFVWDNWSLHRPSVPAGGAQSNQSPPEKENKSAALRKQGMMHRSWARNLVRPRTSKPARQAPAPDSPLGLRATAPRPDSPTALRFRHRAPVPPALRFRRRSRRCAPAAALPIPRSAMSRGTRRGGEVIRILEEEDDGEPYYSYPTQVCLPAKFSQGKGCILSINKHLCKLYGCIGSSQDQIKWAMRSCDRNPYLSKMYNKEIAEGRKDTILYAEEARSLIAQVHALGGQPFVAWVVNEFIELVKEPVVVPNGSLSYLCDPPHHFDPENMDVPQGLPTVRWEVSSNPDGVAETNTYLKLQYNTLARYVNQIRYFRDHRIRLGFNAEANVMGNLLKDRIKDSHLLFSSVVNMISGGQQSYGDELFLMPVALRDKILEDHSVINYGQLPDISCLYPEGVPESSPTCKGRAIFLLFESALGYSIFWVYNTFASASLLNFESFTSVVKLIVHHPFESQAIALQEFQLINNDTCSAMLKIFLEMYLPEPADWSWNSIRLGVCRRKFGRSIQDKTGIRCRTRKHSLEKLRGGIQQYLHLFLEMEQAHLVEAQQALVEAQQALENVEDDIPKE